MHHGRTELGPFAVGLPPGAALSADAFLSAQVFGMRGAASNPALSSGGTNNLEAQIFSLRARDIVLPVLDVAAHVTAYGGIQPPATKSAIREWVNATVPFVSLVHSGNSADARHASLSFNAGSIIQLRFNNDAFNVSTDALTFTGTGSAVSLGTIPVATSFVVGHTASVTAGLAGRLQVVGTTTATAQSQVSHFAADANGPTLALSKSRNATAGSNTIVVNGDRFGTLAFYGANGSTYTLGCEIAAYCDGTPGASNDMPTSVVINTRQDGASSLSEAVRVDLNQNFILGGGGSRAVGKSGRFQQLGDTDNTSAHVVGRYSANASGADIILGKSRGALYTNTIVQSGDLLGSISAYGADGTNFDLAAQILFEVGGTPGAGTDMPGQIRFMVSPDASATPAEALKIGQDKVCTFAADPAGRIIGGTYAPTRSAEANMDGNVTVSSSQYMRVGPTVTVSGTFTADPTLTATTTSFEMTLPVASNIGAIEDVAGVAFCGAIAGMGAQITGVVANDTAKVEWISTDVTSQTWSFTFTYQVI